jgi:UDPglucose 6-dehydrogenase
MRDAPSIAIIQTLQDAGAAVVAYDPEGVEQARHVLRNVDYRADAYAAVEGADAMVLVTEWDEFRALDLGRVRKLLKEPVLVDLRNVYRPEEMARHGFAYHGVGR